MTGRLRIAFAALALAALSVASAPAQAGGDDHGLGTVVPELTVEGPDGHKVRLSDFRGRVVVLIHEDRDSAEQNQVWKKRIAGLGKEAEKQFASFAIADVAKYDFWPARNIVRRELKKAIVDGVIYADWRGEVKKTLKLPTGVSSVLILGRDGTLLFRHEGTLSGADLEAAVKLMRDQGVPGF